jgi:hypothetical protein
VVFVAVWVVLLGVVVDALELLLSGNHSKFFPQAAIVAKSNTSTANCIVIFFTVFVPLTVIVRQRVSALHEELGIMPTTVTKFTAP